jgi:prevent-host-death family protein
MVWALQDAKAKFSEVVKRAQTEGPQEVTVRGEPAAVVLSLAEFKRMTEQAQILARPKASTDKEFIDFLLDGPPWPDDLCQELAKSRSARD